VLALWSYRGGLSRHIAEMEVGPFPALAVIALVRSFFTG
jgi:hypothetical protein